MCLMVLVIWMLSRGAFFLLSNTSSNLHHSNNISTNTLDKLIRKDSSLLVDIYNISRSEAINLRSVNKDEVSSDFDSKLKVKVKLQTIQIAGNESLPEHKSVEDTIPAEIRMTRKDNERHYFTLHKTRINPIEVDFIINGAQICGTNSNYMTLLILVPSIPSHPTVRNAIRATYGTFANQRFTIHNSSVEVTVRLAFLVGKDDTIDSDPNVRSESRHYGDIIYANFVEAYENLTRKMLIALKWVSVYCSGLSFFLKIDEDVFVNIPLLASELHKRPYNIKGSIYGYLHMQSPVYRKGKWAVTKDEYPMLQYPKYTAGNSYVISGNIIPRMFIISEYMPHMPIEDVFITGCIAKIVEAKHVSIPGFAYWHEDELGACQFIRDKRISSTKITVNKMYKFWNASINYHEFC